MAFKKLSTISDPLFKGIFALYLFSLATSMSGMELFSTLLVAYYLLSGQRNLITTATSLPVFWPIVSFVLISMVGIYLGDAPYDQKIYDLGRLRFFLFFFILTALLIQKKPSDSFWLRSLTAICIVVGIYGFIQHFISIDLIRPEGKKVLQFAIQEEKLGPLVVGTFNHHLTFSNIYFLYGALFTAIGVVTRRIAFLGLGLFIFLLCFWTYSRAAWVALAICLPLLLIPYGKRVIGIGITALLCLGLASYILDTGFRERLNRTVVGDQDEHTLGPRQRLWRAQWEFFKQSPLYGVGFNNNERFAKPMVDKLYPERQDNFYGHAHSMPLQVLATTGILGTLAFYSIWWQLFAMLIPIYRRSNAQSIGKALALGLLIAFIGFHIQGFTQWNFGDAETLHNILFLWALTAWLHNRSLVTPR